MAGDLSAIAARRVELERRMQDLVSKKAVLESRISALCQKLGLDHVPSEEELHTMLQEQEAKLSEMSARCQALEKAVAAWETQYAELNGKSVMSV